MQFSIKRLDLLHPEAPGNKYFKLKYNLLKARERRAKCIVSVGGPFSNHLHALASACAREGIKCIGLVHGICPPVLSPTLQDCESMGMQLEFIERSWYALRNDEAFKQWVHEKWQEAYFVPEGGSNYLGLNGCMEILSPHDRTDVDTIVVPVGTGTTLGGILLSCHTNQRILAFPALRDESLPKRLEQQLYWALVDEELASDLAARVEWVWDYTFGGFAKCPPELKLFIEQKASEGLPLDRVYTSKMIFGLEEMTRRGLIGEEERVLAIHTGGLQGNRRLKN